MNQKKTIDKILINCKNYKTIKVKLKHFGTNPINCDNLYMIKQEIPITLMTGILIIIKDECYRHSLCEKIIRLDTNLYFLKYSQLRCVVLYILKN